MTVTLLAWASTAALGLLALVALRQSVLLLYAALRLGQGAFGLVDKCALVLLGFTWLGLVVYAQHSYFGAAAGRGGLRLLRARFLRATALEVGILVGAAALQRTLAILV